jgi:hypothetical protein
MVQSRSKNSRPIRTPKYRRQKSANGQDRAFVVLDGKREYLGSYNSNESREQYHRLLAEWSANGGMRPVRDRDLAVVELIRAYWRYAEVTYRGDDGELTHYANRIRIALRPVRRLYSRTSAGEFGPHALKAVRHPACRGAGANGYDRSELRRARRREPQQRFWRRSRSRSRDAPHATIFGAR